MSLCLRNSHPKGEDRKRANKGKAKKTVFRRERKEKPGDLKEKKDDEEKEDREEEHEEG